MIKYSGMKGREIDHIPDRLIEEPVVFRGMTDTEVISLIVAGTVFWIPISAFILSAFGFALFGVGVGFGLALLTLIIAGSRLTAMKRKLPDGLHLVAIKKFIQKKISFNMGYIDKTQSWDIRRTYTVEKEIMQVDDE